LKPWKLTSSVVAAFVLLYIVWAIAFVSSTSVSFESRNYFCLFDDAMISMRYAWNFAHGHGLVWNPGDPVEGITNFLMTIYMSVGALLFSKSGAVLFVQISGIFFVVGSALVSYRIGRLLELSASSCVLIVAGTLAYYPLSFWSLMGMETGLLTLLSSLALLVAIQLDTRSRGSIALGLLTGAMFATRPDAGLPAVLILTFRFYAVMRAHKSWRAMSDWLREPGVFVAIFVGLTVFRLIYYRDALPNTYSLKVVGWELRPRLQNGWEFVRPFLGTIRYLLLLAAVSIAFRRDRNRVMLAAFSLAIIVYQVWAGGDAWWYWRIAVPAVVVLVVLAADGATSFLRKLSSPDDKEVAALVCGAVVMLAVGVADTQFVGELFLRDKPYTVAWSNEPKVRAGLTLARVADPRGSVGVVTAGAVPYYSGMVGIDFLGKSDRYIAHLKPDLALGFNGMRTTPGHNKYDLHYSIEKLQPDVIEIDSWGKDNLSQFVAAHYVRRGQMWVKKGSPFIHWDKLGSL